MMEVSAKYSSGELIHGRYKVVRLLGQGGMAEVYLVQDIELNNQLVALKLLFSYVSNNNVNIERFIREVELTRKQNHPNIVRSYHYGKTERNEQYFTMEYVEGKSLAQILIERGKISYQEVFYYVAQVASALSAAHRAGIVHRDIKPDNIILAENGVVKVSDFGIAKDLNSSVKLTEQEKGPKSYAYKAPELYVEEYDHRVDIYSLGITTYELLTGQLPFSGERHQLIVAHLKSPIPVFTGRSNAVPEWFQEFVEIASAKKAKDRFSNCDQIIEFLRGHRHEIKAKELIFPNLSNVIPEDSNWKRFRIFKRIKRIFGELLFKYAISIFIGILIFLLYMPILPNYISTRDYRLIGDALDLHLVSLFFKIRGEITKPDKIVIISIDDLSYEKLGLSTLRPWPRVKSAELLEKLKKKAPKMIIFDYVFPVINDPALKDTATDVRLAEAMKQTPTYIAKFLDTKSYTNEMRSKLNVEPIWMNSDKLFLDSVKGIYPALILDSGVVRNFYFGPGSVVSSSGKMITPIASTYYGLDLNNKELPNYQDMINYYGPPGTIDNISVFQILEEKFDASYFENKIIFVGLQLALDYELRQRDTFVTPFGGYMSGVEIHATTLGNLIDRSWIKRLPIFYEGIVLTLLAIFFTYLMLSIRANLAFIFMLSAIFIWPLIAYCAFIYKFFFPALLLVLVVLPLGYFVSILKIYKQKKESDQILGLDEI